MSPAPNLDRPETPPGIRQDIAAVESFAQILATSVEGIDKRLDGVADDVRELRQQMREHEKQNVERERGLRGEIQSVRADVRQLGSDVDGRLDGIEQTLKVLVDRQPVAPPDLQGPGPITAAFGLPPRKPSGSTGLVAGGGLSLAAVLGLLTQLAALPVALQWAMAAIAAAAAITACVVVGVRMVRRD